MAITTAHPTVIPATTPIPNCDLLPLDEAPRVLVGTELAPRVSLMIPEDPPELGSVMVDIMELPVIISTEVWLDGGWVTILVDGCALVASAGLAQAFHCARLMLMGVFVPTQFVFN
jgi:hypothetical protein